MHFLGIYITNDCENLFDVSERITEFYGRVHFMTARVGNSYELVALELLEKQGSCSCAVL